MSATKLILRSLLYGATSGTLFVFTIHLLWARDPGGTTGMNVLERMFMGAGALFALGALICFSRAFNDSRER